MSVGIDRYTGQLLVGWPRVSHSIATIISTAVGERIELRDYGSKVGFLQDKPQTPDTILQLYMETAEALYPVKKNGAWYGEPCFHLTRVYADLSDPGKPLIAVDGVHYPNGHLGDYSIAEDRSLRVVVR